jgi:hypothetical protein
MSRRGDTIATRVREIRMEFFAEEGQDGLASMLGLPCRTWNNYEHGVSIPGEILLQFLEMTGINPVWLLHGIGEKFHFSPD